MGKRVSIYTEMLVELRRRIEGERCFTDYDREVAYRRARELALRAVNDIAVLYCRLASGEIDMQYLGYEDEWDELMCCKVSEGLGDVVDSLRRNLRRFKEAEFQEASGSSYRELAEGYVKGFDKGSVGYMLRDYLQFKERYVVLTVEVLERRRDEYVRWILESEFMGTHYKEEVKDGMEYLRRFVCYSEGRYVLGDMIMLGRHIYKNRREVTDVDVEEFLGLMFMIDRVQRDMDRLKFGDDCELDEIGEFDARGVMKYVRPLNGCSNIDVERVSRIWRRLIMAHGSLVGLYNNVMRECFVESADGSDFRKAFVLALIGEMRGKVYVDDTRRLAEALMDGSKTVRTLQQAIEKRLGKIGVTDEAVEVIRRIVREG